MTSREIENQIYGSDIYTYKPVINANEVYIEDFKKNIQGYYDLPFNFIRIRNASLNDIILVLENESFTISQNETQTIDNKDFSHLEIHNGTNAVTSGQIVFNVQKQGMNADKFAREQYKEQFNPLNKIKKSLGVLGGFIR